ncbi:MAG TPA: glycosyltransferase family 1 protein [Kiritimatiellia bacterium]|nr:glycosyltransferase family 1 protein [Kiritimatiellia bacterium]HRZ13366.1 glycosyltransferase family 1 protein [Kiritimatiellia bacterium]HSA18994.1 glycosyltransferase family 1 protein [Kiritimatiellia bacterium]
MRIGVLARGLAVRVGGVTTFLENVIPLLPRLDPANRYVIYHHSARHGGAFPGAEEHRLRGPGTLWQENVALPLALRRRPVDVLLCAKNFVPAFLPRGVKTVAIVYDLLYYPVRGASIDEYKPLDVLAFRALFPRGLRRADRIIAISESTRRDLLDLFPLDPARVRAVPLGVSPPAPGLLAEEALRSVRSRYGLDRPYFFYCGSLSPRKNAVRTLEAFARIRDRVPHNFVVTAGKSWKDRAVFRAVERLGLRDRFRRLGAVPAADLPALYRAADAFVYVSLYEGFGLPILEAMSCGCPVLTSRASAMPEAAGDAALLVDPADVGAIAEGLERILKDRALADGLRVRGARRAAEFTWEATARHIIEVLAELRPADRPPLSP